MIAYDHAELIEEYPIAHKFYKRGGSQHPDSPSRFKLGMYKKNMVLEPPRRNNLTLKWESALTKKPPVTEVKQRNNIIDQFMNDYASARPGPTVVPKRLRLNQTQQQDQMFAASLVDEEAAHSVRSSLEKGLVTYSTKA